MEIFLFQTFVFTYDENERVDAIHSFWRKEISLGNSTVSCCIKYTFFL
jgi:hypothetical protein